MYPSLYYAFRDLFGLNIPALKVFQTFGFFVAISFLLSAWLLSKELQRKEKQGLLSSHMEKRMTGQPATTLEMVLAGLFGFLIGYKLLYIIFNFSEFSENTQGFLLSLKGNFIGALAGAAIAVWMKYSEKQKLKKPTPELITEEVHPYQLVGNITLIAAFSGLIGAKIFHNLENWNDFVADPVHSLLSFSGLTMYGGLICASIACIWYGKKKGIAIPHLIDAAAPSLMLGYGFGRIGCHMAGDGDWGIPNLHAKPSWLSWAPDWVWSFDYPHNVNDAGVPIDGCLAERYCTHLVPSVYPTPFYEAVICIALFFVLWYLRKKITTPGMLFSLYLVMNGVERFFIEKIRVNTRYDINGFTFTQAELISLLLFLTGVAGIIYFRKKGKPLSANQYQP